MERDTGRDGTGSRAGSAPMSRPPGGRSRRSCSAAPGALDVQLQRDAGISHFEYMVLSSLSEAPAPDPADERPRGECQRVTVPAVARGQPAGEAGRVRRGPCPGDGRFVNAVLTDDGWDKVVATAPGHVEAVRRLVMDALSAQELSALGCASGKVLGAIRDGVPSRRRRVIPSRCPSQGSVPFPRTCALRLWLRPFCGVSRAEIMRSRRTRKVVASS